MFRIVLGTLGTRILSAAITFAVWIINANVLEAGKVGTISLIIFSVAIVQLVTNFVAGTALIYYTPRTGVNRLLVPAYLLIPVLALLTCAILVIMGHLWPVTEIIPAGYSYHVLGLSLIMSFTSANYMFLLGLEKVSKFNKFNLLQILILILVLLLFLFGFRIREVISYYWAITFSYFTVMLLSCLEVFKSVKNISLSGTWPVLKDILKFGTFVQFANLFQTMNYRLSLKFVDFFLGRASVGVLSIGMQLSEGLWLISRSMGTVQYSRMSNEMDFNYSVRLTLAFIKIAFTITAIAMIILVLIPVKAFLWIFPASFTDIKLVINSLAVGIVMLSVSIILSGFFSAINKPVHNMVSSAIGLIFTISAGIILIPSFGIIGAGYTASISYTVITLYQLMVFLKISKVKPRDFLSGRKELLQFRTEFLKIFSRPA